VRVVTRGKPQVNCKTIAGEQENCEHYGADDGNQLHWDFKSLPSSVISMGLPFSIALLHQAIEALALAVTPVIVGILLIGLILALLQGAFQVEDATLALAAKLAITLMLASTSGVAIFLMLSHLAHQWMSNIPAIIARNWS
jgi:flagellar biosynthesis protein FliQ